MQRRSLLGHVGANLFHAHRKLVYPQLLGHLVRCSIVASDLPFALMTLQLRRRDDVGTNG